MTTVEAMAHLDEMVTVYEGDELETAPMIHVSESIMENMTTHIEEGERLKAVIKALIKDFDEEKEGAEKRRQDCHVEEEIMQIESDSQRAKRQTDELKGQVTDMNTKREEMRNEVEELKAKHREALAALRQGDLYNTVAQIRWLKDEDNLDMVKGTVVNKSGVKPFSLDSKQQSKNFICNYVWGLMEADW